MKYDDAITLKTNRMCASVFSCFKFFSFEVLMWSVWVDNNPHEQKLFRVLNNF